MKKNHCTYSYLHTLCILGAFGFVLTGCSNSKHESPEVVHVHTQSNYHTVKKGDTLDSIATRYHIAKTDLILINHIKPPYKIYPKQILKIKMLQKKNQKYYAQSDELIIKNLPSETQTETTNEIKTEEKGPTTGIAEDASQTPPNPPFETTLEKPNAPHPTEKKPVSDEAYNWPVFGKVIQTFGQKAKDGTIQESLGIQAPAGTKVKSVTSGTVFKAGKFKELRELDNIVVIKQDDGRVSIYGFLKEIYVKKGQKVFQNDPVGTVGMNKIKNKAMLAYQLRASRNGKLVSIDPMPYLPH